ncbi:MAG: thiamine pyrophosphate-dependent enzyme, partial [Hydrogenobacter thermophilus]|nr:thiamine pyrophosphate-dependent enzyme [Hydrogenobacter thermophilus]
TRIDRVSAFRDIYLKAKDYMPALQVDGMDVFAVYEAVVIAKKYLEDYGKPYFIEAITYRYEGHSMADKGDYRSPREIETFRKKDPIENLKNKAMQMGWLTPEQIRMMDEKIAQIIEEAVEFALNSPEPDLEELYKDIYCGVCADVIP